MTSALEEKVGHTAAKGLALLRTLMSSLHQNDHITDGEFDATGALLDGIAPACNAHDDLVEALQAALTLQRAHYGDATSTHMSLRTWAENAEQIIAKARGSDA